MKKRKAQKSNDETVKFKKEFKFLKVCAMLVEGVFMVPIVSFLLAVIISVIIFIGTGRSEIFNEILMPQNINVEENSNRFELIVEDWSGKEINSRSVAITNVLSVLVIVGYIIKILIIDNLYKLFKEASEKGTPFTENTIKYLNRINICAILLFICGDLGLTLIIILEAITYIFKCGYTLQKQSDETI